MSKKTTDSGNIQPTAELFEKIAACEDKTTKTYACTLVTPMYGGGVEAGTVDLEMPIRASSIRGQLRFWWRLIHAQGLSADEMFAREVAIWGGIGDTGATASKVVIRVTGHPANKQGDLQNSSEFTDFAVKYAFGSAAINGDAKWLKSSYEFALHIRYPQEVAEQVETTLRWWASFGGLGARSRRGFGAIQMSELKSVTENEVADKGGHLQLMTSGSQKPDRAWKASIERLRLFRQGNGFARTQGDPRPGRSFWPEPDQIRRFTNRNDNGRHMPVHAAGNVFPRAAFGLPITFEFRGTPNDPQKTELHPTGDSDRMASPLILRPYWDGSHWRGAALLLPGWEKALQQTLKFKDNDHYAPDPWPTDPAKRKKLAQEIRPMQNRGDDPLTAFMNYFVEGQ